MKKFILLIFVFISSVTFADPFTFNLMEQFNKDIEGTMKIDSIMLEDGENYTMCNYILLNDTLFEKAAIDIKNSIFDDITNIVECDDFQYTPSNDFETYIKTENYLVIVSAEKNGNDTYVEIYLENYDKLDK